MHTLTRTFAVSFACFMALSSAVQAEPPSTPSSVNLRPSAAPAAASGEPRTLLSHPIQHGAYGGPVVAYTRFASSDSVLVGARGGWIIDHQLVVGGGGFGIANRVHPPIGATPDDNDYRLNFGYGGVWLEYLIAPMQVVHGSIGVLVGGGGVNYTRFRPADDHDSESDAVFVLDPVAAVEVNVVRFMHLALQIGYRFVSGVELKALRNRDVSGFTFGAIAKFGIF